MEAYDDSSFDPSIAARDSTNELHADLDSNAYRRCAELNKTILYALGAEDC
jgi:hypothetical protein